MASASWWWWCRWWRRPSVASAAVLILLIVLVFGSFLVLRGEESDAADLPSATGDVADSGELGEPLRGPSSEDDSIFPIQKAGKRALLALPSVKSDFAIVAFLDGTIYLADSSGTVLGSFSSGPPLSTSYQALTEDDSGNEHYLYCEHDWKLYEYSKAVGKKKLGMTADEYVNKTPIIAVDGGVTLGSNRSTGFYFDSNTGKVISSYWTDGFQAAGGMGSNDDKSIIVKPKSGSHFEPNVPAAGPFYIVRRDYAISRYTNLRKLSWSMTVSYIEAYSCTGFDCTVSKKLPVYQVHDVNPRSLGLGFSKVFQLPEASSDNDLVPDLPSTQSPLALNVLNNTEKNWTTLYNPSEINNNSASNGGLAQPVSVNSSPISARYFSNVLGGHSAWYLMPFLFFLAPMLYMVFKKSAKADDQSTDVVKKPNAVNKKRKPRKNNSKSSSPLVKQDQMPSPSDIAETSVSNGTLKNDRDLLLSLLGHNTTGDGKWVGKLFVSNVEIAKGSNGTVVLEGVYDGRSVAIKRLVRAHHDVASKEIQNLIASDKHPNIVRWFGVEYDSDFVYLSLERCACSLNDLIQFYSDSSASDMLSDIGVISECKVNILFSKITNEDIELWKENGCPSSQLIKLMRDVVSGLAHLHELGIVHRDMKPQNVLITSEKVMSAKLSDMGISKRLPDHMSSLGQFATGHGSSGWQAPEQLLHGRQTRAVDLFSLGCVLFFCITKGGHPFGAYFERDANIINNRVDLFMVEHIPEAVHLFSEMLNPDPEKRPKTAEVLQHPLFWDSETRLCFLRDSSDRVELEDREKSDLLKALEKIGSVAFGGKWGEKLDAPFLTDMGRYRKYKFECTRDLLRVIRNKLNHYRELPMDLKELLGSVPEGFDDYFSCRFPRLLIEVYKVMHHYCREDVLFKKYF